MCKKRMARLDRKAYSGNLGVGWGVVVNEGNNEGNGGWLWMGFSHPGREIFVMGLDNNQQHPIIMLVR